MENEADKFEAQAAELRDAYKTGRKDALLEAILLSDMHHRPTPDWVAAVVQAGSEALFEINEVAHGLRFHMKETNDYAQSFTLIAEFFAKCSYIDIAEYIGRLALAISDSAQGIADPLLTRRGKSKRDPIRKWQGRMWAALGYECLLKSGMTQPAADRHIAMKYRRLEPLLRGRGNLKTSVRAWRVGFMNQDKTMPRELHRSFRTLYAENRLSENLPKDEYRRWAKNFLRKAVEIGPTLGAFNKSRDLSKES